MLGGEDEVGADVYPWPDVPMGHLDEQKVQRSLVVQ